jgi:hypothetical protein
LVAGGFVVRKARKFRRAFSSFLFP